jgi:predicted TPR repeat methyltransferase
MNPTGKRRSFTSILGEAQNALKSLLVEQPRDFLVQVKERARDLPKTNFDLACRFADQGKWHDALFRFRVALFFKPGYPQANYNMACCHFRLGQRAKAIALLKQVIASEPGNHDAVFMLAAIEPGALSPTQKPQSMPRELVTKFFNSIAGGYNQTEAENKYCGGTAVAEQVKPLLPASGITVVDLGCGTGIASIPFRSIAAQLIGVDVTASMVAQAQKEMLGGKPLFDRVVEADINVAGEVVTPASADLVLLVNAVQFVGALNGTLASAARMLKPGGFLALTVEPYSGGDGFGIVRDSGRFGHAPGYVKQLAAPLGLTPVKELKTALYPETRAELLIFRKGGAA